jgi:hypothetical protein
MILDHHPGLRGEAIRDLEVPSIIEERIPGPQEEILDLRERRIYEEMMIVT